MFYKIDKKNKPFRYYGTPTEWALWFENPENRYVKRNTVTTCRGQKVIIYTTFVGLDSLRFITFAYTLKYKKLNVREAKTYDRAIKDFFDLKAKWENCTRRLESIEAKYQSCN